MFEGFALERIEVGDAVLRVRHGGSVAGHDRGLYVAQRLAMDHPDPVRRLCLMEGIPIAEALARCDAEFAASGRAGGGHERPGRPGDAGRPPRP